MTRKGYAATCMPDKRELQRMRRWDRQSGKTAPYVWVEECSVLKIDHGKESLRQAITKELREFAK